MAWRVIFLGCKKKTIDSSIVPICQVLWSASLWSSTLYQNVLLISKSRRVLKTQSLKHIIKKTISEQSSSFYFFLLSHQFKESLSLKFETFQRKFSDFLKLIPSTVFDSETRGLFYFIHKLVVYNSTSKYFATSQLVKKSTGICNIVWKF